MNLSRFTILTLLMLCGFAARAEWCYQSQVNCDNPCEGPEDWTEDSETCGNKKQSPINIVTSKVETDTCLSPVKFIGYNKKFKGTIINNGHTVQVNLPGTARIKSGNFEATYKAKQFHMHWGKDGEDGSEHSIDGERYPMELHIVHIKENFGSVNDALDDPTGLAVLGFFFEESETANENYNVIINTLKDIIAPDTTVDIEGISLDMLIPPLEERERYFRYKGSLTVPNCAESVIWTVYEKPIPLSKEQLSAFTTVLFHGGTPMVNTFRPVQPRNGRIVYYSRSCVFCFSTTLLVSSVITSLCVFTV